ncbi:MAG: amino acid adenylation domain-containing protein [Deltaproteobacteria bacterium]
MEFENSLNSLTNPQKAMWYTEKVYPGTSIGNVAGTLRLKGEIDYSLLEKAINIFIEKNEGIRLRVKEINGEPKQYISAYAYHKLDFLDFSNKKDADLYKWDEHLTKEPFVLIDSDLFYFALIKVNEQDGGFYIKTHHLISDAWTMTLLVNQIIKNYSLLRNGQEISKENNPSYIEFIINENEYNKSKRFEKDKEYWNNKFETIIEPTALKQRTSNYISTKARRKTLIVPKKLSGKMHEYCLDNKTSVFSIFTAALAMYINRVTTKEEIILGTTTLNRSDIRQKETIGMFSNIASIFVNVNHNMDFKTLVNSISKDNMALLRHQKYPYDLLLKEVRARHKTADNLFDIVINYQNSKLKKNNNEEFFGRWHFNGHQVESLSISIDDRENEGELLVNYDYLIELFHVKEIEFIHQHIMNLLWHALDNSEKQISKLNMLSEKEKHKILFDFNNTKADYPKDKTIHQMFEEQAAKTPDNIAVVFEDKKLTYRELNEKSNQLARILREKGVKPDSIVGIMIYRSIEMIVGVMGILKAGGAYLPIDPDYPKDRIEYMLEDSNALVLLTETALKEAVKFDGEFIDLKCEEIYSGDTSNISKINKPTDLAYVIYTSGSTGKPKGVMIEHFGVINRINWMQKKYPINEKSAILQKTPFTFDVSVWELFWWFFVGARVCMLEPAGEKEPEKIIKAIEENKITTMHFVPSMLSMFLQYIEENTDLKRLKTLKQVFASGEALNVQKVALFNNLLNKVNGSELYNLYGPTEATVDVSYYDCSTGEIMNVIPIGRPIDNTYLYILDKNYNLQPIGISGELCIGGDQVARGYLNKPELTNEKFIPNPFRDGERIYRTGDLARWFPDGDIEYLGRLDFQVKIRGNRIELGEIENKLLSYQEIKDCIVLAKEDNGNKYLCAYYVSDEEISVEKLRKYLLKELPDYMIPSYLIKLNEMPLSSNGKVNRKALPNPQIVKIETEYIPPRNEIEKLLFQVWAEVLGIDKIGIDDSFFELGGDSLSVIQILTKIYKYKWNLTTQDFYKYKTIRELSNKIMRIEGMNIEDSHIDIEKIEPQKEIEHISNERNKYENILLTGVTGYLGSHILRELLENTDVNVYCLIRGKDKEESKNRLINVLDYYFENKYKDMLDKRIKVIKGDVTKDNFGLIQAEYNKLGEKIDAVVHCAAIVKYYGDYSEFDRVNVCGTKRIIDFSLKYGKKLNHISTMSVTGNYLVDSNVDNIIFTENDFYVGQNYLGNFYVRSKFETENLIFKAMKQGLNATIYRVGNLVARYEDGFFQKNIKENAFYNTLKSIIELKAVPEEIEEEDIEFTPVDYTSRIISSILMTTESNKRVFHIYNHNTLKLKQIIQILNNLGIHIEIMNKEKFDQRLAEVSQNETSQGILEGIINDINEKTGLSYTALIYSDSNITQRYIKKLSCEWPVIDERYIMKLLEHMREVEYLK